MTAARQAWAAELLHFWFRRFGRDLAMLGKWPTQDFLRDPLTARAAVLLFDQVPLGRKSSRAEKQAIAAGNAR